MQIACQLTLFSYVSYTKFHSWHLSVVGSLLVVVVIPTIWHAEIFLLIVCVGGNIWYVLLEVAR
jgi:hypothetical protein